MSMIPHLTKNDLFGESDYISVAISLVFVAILTAYMIFVAYFTFFKSQQLADFHIAKAEETNIDRAEKYLHKALVSWSKAKKSIKNERDMKFVAEILDKIML